MHRPRAGRADLRAGDILVLVNGEYVVLEKVQHELLESPVKVYNFQVEDYHTYYVAQSGVLVHNDCRRTSPNQMQRQVERGQAPNTVDHVDGGFQDGSGKPHVHFTDNTALNWDGTVSHEGNGIHIPTGKEAAWLKRNGWEWQVKAK